MEVFSVKHKPSVWGPITGSHAGITFGDYECAERYAELVGSEVEERESADISSCRIFQAPDYVTNTHALIDSWEAAAPPKAPAPSKPPAAKK